MNGPDCPTHKVPMHWLSTRNEWEYFCPLCDKRYNAKMEVMPPLADIPKLKMRW